MLDILPLWLYCCLTLALLAAVASMAELDLPGVECLGDPLLREATTQCYRITEHSQQHSAQFLAIAVNIALGLSDG